MSLDTCSCYINTVTIITTFILVFYLYSKYKLSYWSRRGIYSPPSHWLFGHLRDAILMRASPPKVLGELHNSSKESIVGVYILHKPFLLLRNHEIIKQVLVKDFNVFPDRYFASKRKTDVIGSQSLFAIDNPQWKYLRMKLSPAFTTGKQKRLFELMLENADTMSKYLKGRIPDSCRFTLDARKVSSKYTTDVISSLAFGIRTNSFSEPEPEFYIRSRKIFDLSFFNAAKLFVNFFFPKLNDYVGAVGFGEHTDYFRKIFWESMTDREKSGVKRGDVIDLLLELKNEKQSPEFTFQGDYLVAQSGILFVAGLETSSVTMAFTLFELAKHTDIQEKVRQEIREKIGDETFTYERINEMTYLQQVVSEVLRLYPPAPLIDRIAVDDYKIPGTDVTIEKGTVIYATLTGLHMDPEYHPEPLKFDPDRFSEERKRNIKPCTYMPFGDGPRICVGQRTGLLQAMVGLITILKEYKVSINSNFKNEVSKRAIFLAPSGGINLYFERDIICK